MSRVRIYELAKEAGMASKDLADKLIAQGYDIKGHSSTVDDETAEKIRKTVLQSSTTERVEKRIDDPSGSTVIRRRSTIIRRKAKTLHEDADQDQDISAEVEAEEAAEVIAEEKQPEEVEAAATTTAEPTEDAVKTEPVVDEKEAADVAQAQSDADADSSADTALDAEVTDEQDQDADAVSPESAEVEAKVKKKSAKKEKKISTKKLARVVGTIDIPIEEEKTIPARPKRKPARGGAGAPPSEAAVVGGSDAAVEAGRARKKGKKGVVEADDDEFGRKGGKGVKKGKKSVKYTHFGNDYQRTGGRRGRKGGKGRRDGKPVAPPLEMKASKKRIKVFDSITVGDLAAKMRVKANEVIAKLMGLGVMATMNQSVDVETAMLIATDFGYEVEQGVTEEIGIQMLDQEQEVGETKPRPPVVTVMGHVDHGKTSILDAIRKTDVAEGEAGGITQHIGAYLVKSPAGDVTFVDTPGHAAFTEMRARGAQVTDLVVLVVAADDGVMGQTREAIHHAQAADVPIIVAVNKIDKDNADPDRVKRELAELELAPEEWGGQTIYCETSAKKNIGIENLLENIQLMAEILELKANPDRKAKGRVIEARLDKGRGAVATVMVQQGTLRDGDYFVVGQYSGKVRALSDYKGRKIDFVPHP